MRQDMSDKEARALLTSIAPVPDDIEPRVLDCAVRYARGETYQAIGAQHNITRERVRQLIKNSPWSPDAIRAKVFELEEGRVDEVVARVKRWSDDNPGQPLATGVKTLGVDERTMRSILGPRVRAHLPSLSKAGSKKRATNDDIIAAMKQCAKDTGELTTASFSQWAREHDSVGPQTAAQRFGSWAKAVNASGVRKARSVERFRRHSDEDLWAALVEGMRHDPTFTSDEWARWAAQDPDVPSLATIRTRLALSWAELRDEALRIIAGTSDRGEAWMREVTRPRNWPSISSENPATNPQEHVRAAIEQLGPDLSIVQYNEWASKEKRPQYLTLRKHSGLGWADMVEQAGGIRPRPKVAKLSDEQIAQALKEFFDSQEDTKVNAYQAWAAEREMPSLQTVFRRVGPWSIAHEWAEATLSGRSVATLKPKKVQRSTKTKGAGSSKSAPQAKAKKKGPSKTKVAAS